MHCLYPVSTFFMLASSFDIAYFELNEELHGTDSYLTTNNLITFLQSIDRAEVSANTE